jgi:hypothetical protein
MKNYKSMQWEGKHFLHSVSSEVSGLPEEQQLPRTGNEDQPPEAQLKDQQILTTK